MTDEGRIRWEDGVTHEEGEAIETVAPMDNADGSVTHVYLRVEPTTKKDEPCA